VIWLWDAEWIWTPAGGWELFDTYGPYPVDWAQEHTAQLGLVELAAPPLRYAERWKWYPDLGRWAKVYDRSNF